MYALALPCFASFDVFLAVLRFFAALLACIALLALLVLMLSCYVCLFCLLALPVRFALLSSLSFASLYDTKSFLQYVARLFCSACLICLLALLTSAAAVVQHSRGRSFTVCSKKDQMRCGKKRSKSVSAADSYILVHILLLYSTKKNTDTSSQT